MNEFDGQLQAAGARSALPVESLSSTDAALTRDKLAAVVAHLDALPEREQLTLADAVRTLAPTIKKNRARGYSTDELAAEIRAMGVQVSGRTLARLIASAKPVARARSKRA